MGIDLREYPVPETDDPTPLYRFGFAVHNMYVRGVCAGNLKNNEKEYVDTLLDWHERLIEEWPHHSDTEELKEKRRKITDKFLQQLQAIVEDITLHA